MPRSPCTNVRHGARPSSHLWQRAPLELSTSLVERSAKPHVLSTELCNFPAQLRTASAHFALVGRRVLERRFHEHDLVSERVVRRAQPVMSRSQHAPQLRVSEPVEHQGAAPRGGRKNTDSTSLDQCTQRSCGPPPGFVKCMFLTRSIGRLRRSPSLRPDPLPERDQRRVPRCSPRGNGQLGNSPRTVVGAALMALGRHGPTIRDVRPSGTPDSSCSPVSRRRHTPITSLRRIWPRRPTAASTRRSAPLRWHNRRTQNWRLSSRLRSRERRCGDSCSRRTPSPRSVR
jgi:hypothetical protein